MLVLFETAAGFGIFKVLDEKKLEETQDLQKLFETEQKANKIIQLQQFRKFADSAEALQAGVSLNEGKLCKPLKKLLKKVYADDIKDKLMVWDPKLGSSIKEKLNINATSAGPVGELMRCIKFQIEPLIPGLQEKELTAMSLGLAHNLSRYKLKFSPDKVDTMIIQAINLLDDLDKELNNYIMRAREWYGWHFPELSKILPDHLEYVKTVLTMGTRDNATLVDFSGIVSEEMVTRIQEAAEVSMGTEIIEEDIQNIQFLCREVEDLSAYRAELNEYLSNRMMAISPNLTIIVGELVGARLISHAGSLMNLAKLPASTIQLLGAEKALFSALKARKSTPKYGIIYHASLVSSASIKYKGKMARMLAAKAALASRCDALADNSSTDFTIRNKAKLSSRLSMIEDGFSNQISGRGRQQNFDSYKRKSDGNGYNYNKDESFGGKRKAESDEFKPSKKFKVEVDYEGDQTTATVEAMEEPSQETPKKKKKIKAEVVEEETVPAVSSEKKKKKVKAEVREEEPVAENSSEKKKKKKKSKVEVEEEPVETPKKKKKAVVEEASEENNITKKEKKKKKKDK